MYLGTYLALIYVCPSVRALRQSRPSSSVVVVVTGRRRRRPPAEQAWPNATYLHITYPSPILLPYLLQVRYLTKKKSEAMWYFYLALGLISFWWFLLRPRTGGKSAPPCVTSSKIVPIPLVGVITEFLKSPNDMMKRCYDDFGSVFTIPVSIILVFVAL